MQPKTIIFVTGNSYKFQVAQKALKDTLYKLIQRELDVPEIQDEAVEKVAAFSAQWASGILKKPVVVSDGGCYIEALNGFPGPFARYITQWLSAEDLRRLMQSKKNQRVVWKDCLAYCEPNKKPVTFTNNFTGKIATKIGINVYRKNYSWIDSLFIPDGLSKPLSELSTDKYLEFWSQTKNHNSWQKLLKYLEGHG